MKLIPVLLTRAAITLILAILLASCSGAGGEPTPTVVQNGVSPSAAASPTRKPTSTARPSPTSAPAPTATAEPTTAPTPTLPPSPDDFSQVSLLSYGPLPDWNFFFTFQFISPVKGNYLVETRDPAKQYPCRPLLEYDHPERMICLGRVPAVEKNVDFTIQDVDSGAVVYSGRIAVPFY